MFKRYVTLIRLILNAGNNPVAQRFGWRLRFSGSNVLFAAAILFVLAMHVFLVANSDLLQFITSGFTKYSPSFNDSTMTLTLKSYWASLFAMPILFMLVTGLGPGRHELEELALTPLKPREVVFGYVLRGVIVCVFHIVLCIVVQLICILNYLLVRSDFFWFHVVVGSGLVVSAVLYTAVIVSLWVKNFGPSRFKILILAPVQMLVLVALFIPLVFISIFFVEITDIRNEDHAFFTCWLLSIFVYGTVAVSGLLRGLGATFFSPVLPEWIVRIDWLARENMTRRLAKGWKNTSKDLSGKLPYSKAVKDFLVSLAVGTLAIFNAWFLSKSFQLRPQEAAFFYGVVLIHYIVFSQTLSILYWKRSKRIFPLISGRISATLIHYSLPYFLGFSLPALVGGFGLLRKVYHSRSPRDEEIVALVLCFGCALLTILLAIVLTNIVLIPIKKRIRNAALLLAFILFSAFFAIYVRGGRLSLSTGERLFMHMLPISLLLGSGAYYLRGLAQRLQDLELRNITLGRMNVDTVPQPHLSIIPDCPPEPKSTTSVE